MTTTVEYTLVPEGNRYSVVPASTGSPMAGERRYFRDDEDLRKFLDQLPQTEQLRAIWEKMIAERSAFSVFW